MLKKFWIEILVLATLGVIASFAFAHAASLRICYDDTSVTVDTVNIKAFADGAPLDFTACRADVDTCQE